MSETYKEGTYLHEFTEAVPATKTDTAAIAATTAIGGSAGCLAFVVGGLGLLISLAAFPFGLIVGIPVIIFAIYLGAGTGASVITAKDDMRPTYIRGACPYCGHVREAKQKSGYRIACGRCLNIIVIRGNMFYIPEERLKKFRKQN